jgi:hypothetical protein
MIKEDLEVIDRACLHERFRDLRYRLRQGFEDQGAALRVGTANATQYFEVIIALLRQDLATPAETKRKVLENLSSNYGTLKNISGSKEPGTCQWF